jgi:hypothetical protein
MNLEITTTRLLAAPDFTCVKEKKIAIAFAAL